MSGYDTREQKIKRFFMSLPGKRGIDIPEDVFDRIHPVASGITQPMWGRGPTPEQLQWLHDQGAHTPDRIHAAFAGLDHPHANGLKIGEYDEWRKAHQEWQRHQEHK